MSASGSGDEVDTHTQLDTSSVSAEEFQEISDDKEEKYEKSVSPQHNNKKKNHQSHSIIPSNIRNQISSLPEVNEYITKLLNKINSYERDIKRLKRKSKKVTHNKNKKSSSKRDKEVELKNDSNIKSEFENHIQKELRTSSSEQENEVKSTLVCNGTSIEESKTASCTEVNPVCEWGQEEGVSLADQVREAAESVLQESGFVYQESIGLYYDRSTGYYYDQNSGLYYDGINKTYYTYDEESNLFHVYHQIDNSAKDAEEEEIAQWEQSLKKRKKELRVKKKKKKQRKEDSEEEEGQCSESTESDNEASTKPTSSINDLGYERLVPSAEEVAPCMRLMVLETELKTLRVGTLFLVTCTGGTMGREGSGHAVCIPDINVSKHHATFTFDNGQYLLCDLGSRNGTFLDGTRLSVALQESEPKIVQHGSELRVGCTKIRCHIHPGNETCGHCEPGLVQQDNKSDKTGVIVKEAQHRDELLRLRRRFALTGQQEPDVVAIAEKAGYQDRAGHRRQTVGSLHHGAKTESASLEQAVPESNKGFKLLSKMGWKSGQSLGKDGTGTVEPISLQMRVAKAGLGADNVPAPVLLTKGGKRKQEAWSKTRDRYQQLPNTSNIFEED